MQHVRSATATFIAATLLVSTSRLAGATFNVSAPVEFQASLTAAEANGEDDTINVAAGTYNVSATLTFDTTENHSLTIAGAGASTTILDGGSSVQIMRLSGEGDGDMDISGLTLRHGRNGVAQGFGGALFANNGGSGSTTIDQCIVTLSTAAWNTGGAWLGAVHGTLTVTNSAFTHNSCDEGTSDDGCGLYLYFDTTDATGNAVVRNNDISHNTLNHNPSPVGNSDGAGLMIYHLGTEGSAPSITVEGNTISNNSSYEGAAGASIHILHQQAVITLSGNTFSGNVAGPLPVALVDVIQIDGGGIDLYTDGGTIVVTNNKFLDNQILAAYGQGAGLCLSSLPSGTLQMVGNVFSGNQTAGPGGGAIVNLGSGVTSADIVQNLFVNNQAGVGDPDGSGGGLSLGSDVSVNLTNNTFYGNTADDAGGLSYYAENGADVASLVNTIHWGNTPSAIGVFGAGPVQATYSNIEAGAAEPYFGTGCVDSPPLFFNSSTPSGADGVYGTPDDGLHLTAESPSANTGSNAAVPGSVTLDLAGQARIQNTSVDMGVYEGVAGGPIGHPISGTVSGDVQEGVTVTLSGATTDAAGTDGTGGYSFTDLGDGSYTVTPFLIGYSFTPAFRDVTLAGADSTGNNFAASLNSYPLTYNAGANGSITGTTQQTVNHGGDGTAVTAVAAAGWAFTQWSDGSTDNPRTDTNVTAAVTVTAQYEAVSATVSFALVAGAAGEDAGGVAVRVELSEALEVAVTVPFALSGTATKDDDYTVSASPVSIPAGQTQADITVTPIDEDTAEFAETVVITLGPPTNVGLGTPNVHTLTISDEDTDTNGMSDDWQKAIVDADTNDAITSIADVLPGDDFDGDGMRNKFELDRESDPTRYIVSLKKGWNLISLARLPADNSVAAVLGDALVGRVWIWSDAQFYVTTNELLPLRGHWAYVRNDVTLDFD